MCNEFMEMKQNMSCRSLCYYTTHTIAEKLLQWHVPLHDIFSVEEKRAANISLASEKKSGMKVNITFR